MQLNCHLPIVASQQIRPGSETLATEASKLILSLLHMIL